MPIQYETGLAFSTNLNQAKRRACALTNGQSSRIRKDSSLTQYA